MNLETKMLSDMATLLDPVRFGEAITYLPTGLAAKTVNAVIERNPVRPEGAPGRQGLSRTIEFVISRDATTGLPTIQPGRDEVDVTLDLHDTTVTRLRVTKILRQDPGAWHLEAVR